MRGGIPSVSPFISCSTALPGSDTRVIKDCMADASQVTLPAGYLGSSLIGACLVACVCQLPALRKAAKLKLTRKGVRHQCVQSRRPRSGLFHAPHPVLG
jgi:hypothetical protein